MITLVLCILLSSAEVEGRADCPTWFVSSDNSTVNCKCGPPFNGAISCDSHTESIETRIGWCVTAIHNDSGSLDKSSDREANYSVVVGLCPYFHPYNTTKRVYFKVPSDPGQVNHSMCSNYHRRGVLCGECQEGFGPSAYSFDLHCSNCSDLHTATAVGLYILLEVIPITLLFFVLVVFHLNVMLGPVFGYIIFCQYYVVLIQNDKEIYDSALAFLPSSIVTLTRISMTISAVWNLLFFRFVIPPFCISSNITGIHIHMMGFVTALLPLFLVFLTYAGLELNVPDVCYLRRLLHKLLHTSFSLSDSIIHAFATFIFISISLVTTETQAMVTGIHLYNVHGNSVRKILYADPTITMYTPSHYPYLCFALLLMVILVLCPAVILIVYPTSLYQVVTRYISPRTQLSIKIFVETFQGSFKDGLHGTRDYRILPGLAFFACFIFICVESVITHGSPTHYLIEGIVVIVAALAVSWAKPCKTPAENTSLSFHFMLLGIWSILWSLWIEDTVISTEYLALSLALMPLVPHVIMLVWVLYKLTALWLYRYYQFETTSPWEVMKMVCMIISCRFRQQATDNGCFLPCQTGNGDAYDLLEP